MTDEQGKRGFTIVTILSLVVGAVIGLLTYGSLLDVRSLNVIGLVYILMLGLYAVYVALGTRGRKDGAA